MGWFYRGFRVFRVWNLCLLRVLGFTVYKVLRVSRALVLRIRGLGRLGS